MKIFASVGQETFLHKLIYLRYLLMHIILAGKGKAAEAASTSHTAQVLNQKRLCFADQKQKDSSLPLHCHRSGTMQSPVSRNRSKPGQADKRKSVNEENLLLPNLYS